MHRTMIITSYTPFNRGLFKSNNDIFINAYVNGALQIIKVVPNAYADGIRGYRVVPSKINMNF